MIVADSWEPKNHPFKIEKLVDEKTWSEFVITMNQEYGVTPDVGKRSVNDVLRDVVEEVSKNRDE